MLLAIFIIPFALGTITEFQVRAVRFRPPADRAFMLCFPRIPFYFAPEFLPPLYLLRRNSCLRFACFGDIWIWLRLVAQKTMKLSKEAAMAKRL